MSAKILISAFEPFHKDPENSSQLILEALPELPSISRIILPVVFAEAWKTLEREIIWARPKFVVALGQADTRNYFSIERVALNWRDARIADNCGQTPVDQPISQGNSNALMGDWPDRDWLERVRDTGLDVQMSYSAGTFVCNDLYYSLLEHREKYQYKAVFIHVPLVTGQKLANFDEGQRPHPKWNREDGVRLLKELLNIT